VGNAFRVTIPGMDTSRVSKVDAISATRKVAHGTTGEQRDFQQATSGEWQISNVVLQVSQQHARDFVTWHDDFVIKGNNGADRERTITIEMLDPSLQTVLLTANLSGVGIIAVTPVPAEAGSESVARSRVELYAEKLTIIPGGAKPAEAATLPPAPPADASAQSPATAAPAPTEAPTRIRPAAPGEITPAPAPAPIRRLPR
jgi:phage tail-like protein